MARIRVVMRMCLTCKAKRLALAMVALAAVVTPGPRPAAGVPTTAAFELNAGQKVFWDGDDVDRAQVPDPKLCGIAGPCWEYKIDVAEKSWRLRVALSTKLRDLGDVRSWPDFMPSGSEMIFDLEVWGPGSSEKPAATGSTETVFTGYGVEVFVPTPVAGIYTVRVIPRSVREMGFRMRAKLEKELPTHPGVQLLSPNLRVIPPFEFSFYDPTVNFGPGGGQPAPRASCMEEETEEAGSDPPTMCLRFSMGFENAGEGRFDLAVKSCPSDLVRRVCEVQQRRWLSDGSSQPEDGSEETTFHATHAHFHYENAFQFELFQVEDGWSPGDPKQPTLTGPHGPPRKLGLEPANERMAEWGRFWPACNTSVSPFDSDKERVRKIGFCQHDQHVRGDGTFELQAGWGDIYEWNRSGNYVDFPEVAPGVPRSGFYVVRGEANPRRTVIEADNSDNVSYALVQVFTSGSVQLVERGYGKDPWDPSKSVLRTSP